MKNIGKIYFWLILIAVMGLFIYGVFGIARAPFFELLGSLYQVIYPFSGPIEPQGETPKVANYYLNFEISEQQIEELARYDVITLDMEAQHVNPERITAIRNINDDIVILAYVTSEEIRVDAAQNQGWNSLRHQIYNNIQESWWLKDVHGNHIYYWPDTWMINPDTDWTLYLADFMHEQVLSTGLWDGIIYDNAWDDMGWLKNNWDIDMDRDGQVDSLAEINSAWAAGMIDLLQTSRNLNPNSIIITNGPGDYSSLTNGRIFENFPNPDEDGYVASKLNYFKRQNVSLDPVINIINSNVNNGEFGDETNFQRMRFGLTTSLLGDGYYSFDRGDQTHHETWWYDEYNFDLGTPTSEAYVVADNYLHFQDFENGSGDYYIYNGAYITSDPKEVISGKKSVAKKSTGYYEWNEFVQANHNLVELDANETYTIQFKYKILEDSEADKYFYFLMRSNEGGYSQDIGFRSWNQEKHDRTGEIAAVVTLNNYDDYRPIFGIRGSGKIVIDDIYITRGDSDAHIWQRDYTEASVLVNPTISSQNIALACLHEDENNNIISEITIPYFDGILLRNTGICGAPTTPPEDPPDDDPGDDGDDNTDSVPGDYKKYKNPKDPSLQARIVTMSGFGGGPQMRQFFDNGNLTGTAFFAFPDFMRTGARLATGDIDKDGADEIIVGSGLTARPHVVAYEENGFKRGIDFRPFPMDFTGGVDVAGGDTDGDGKDEVIVSQFTNGNTVKVYRYNDARDIIVEFKPFGNFNGGVTVTAGDVDQDGKDEIICGASVGGGPLVRVFDIKPGQALLKPITFYAFDPASRSGIDVAAGDIDGDVKAEIAVTPLFYEEAWVKVYRYNAANTIVGNWRAFPAGVRSGANVEMFDISNDGRDQVLVGPNMGGGPQVLGFEPSGQMILNFFAYAPTFRGGVVPAGGYF
jgi:hypothetical protein